MSKYGNDPGAIRALVREDEVHRDVYTNPELFALEQEHLFRNTWIYLGHDSQVPKAGDFYTADIAGRPLLMLRGGDGVLRVLYNRCAHKGAKIVNAVAGNTGTVLRCPYHGWTYRADGGVRTIPLKGGYEGTRFDACPASAGMVAVANVENYRGFVFVRLSEQGMDFRDYFGDSLTSIDNMVDRSPEGRLEVAGGVLRYLHNCNWKMFIENLNDAMHPMVAHESSAGTAKSLWSAQPPDAPKPMVIEQFVPFVSGYDFFEKMGVKIYDNGHSYTGVNFSIHSKYSAVPAYEAAMVASVRRGARARDPRGGKAQHRVLPEPDHQGRYPGDPRRAAARGGSHSRRELDVPARRRAGEILQRTLMYSRLINAPMSVVGHDDLLCYRAIQEGLAADGNEWVSLHRNFSADERRRSPASTPAPARCRCVDSSAPGRDSWPGQWARAGGMTTPSITPDAIRDFVYREARLIDEKRFAEWYDLFTEDARYWIPLTRDQPDGENHTSLMFEDKLLLKVRIERLSNPRSFSQQQAEFLSARPAGAFAGSVRRFQRPTG
jgi:benzoate/toluate 1,2-dioxygenase alpha subunit